MTNAEKLTEYWGIQRDGKVRCYHRVVWDSEEHADGSSANMLSNDSTIECIHRTKERPADVRVVG